MTHVPPHHWQHDWDSDYDPYPEWTTHPIEPQVDWDAKSYYCDSEHADPERYVGFHQGWRGVPRDNA